MRVTTKIYQAYKKARKEGISMNDNYNKEIFGIDRGTYLLIDHAIWKFSGFRKVDPDLTDLNKEIRAIELTQTKVKNYEKVQNQI
jgi:hypothetical protein